MASEFLQMAGRAGRRGLDRAGHVVTVQSRFEGVREAGQLATSPADPLVSQFTPSYSMVLNLLQRLFPAPGPGVGGAQLRALPGRSGAGG